MQKFLLSIFSIAVLITAANAQKGNSYPVVVSFYSQCCGVPDSGPIMKLISSFKKQNRIKHMAVDHIGPLGKEGEYYLAFRLKELSKTQKLQFIQQLIKIVPTMHDKGSAEIKENVSIDKADLSSRATITTQNL